MIKYIIKERKEECVLANNNKKEYKALLQVLIFKLNNFGINPFLKKSLTIMDYFIDDLIEEEDIEVDGFLIKIKENLKLNEKMINEEIKGIGIFLNILICFLKEQNYNSKKQSMKRWKEHKELGDGMDIMRQFDGWWEKNRNKI